MIKAVIFDVDGTIVDSEPMHVEAWDKALQLYGFGLKDLSQELLDAMAGRKPEKNAEDMIEELRVGVSAHVLLEQKTSLFMELIQSDLQGMHGLTEALATLQKEGYRLAIGTSQVDPYISLVLDNLHVRDYFEVVVKGSDITHGKPHPETYLTVAERLALAPQECVVIEDATSGIASAKAAGCYCIALISEHAHPQDTSQADRTITSLTDLTKQLIHML